MNALAQIVALYEEINQGFESAQQAALAAANSVMVNHIEQKQLLNDQAYFVLCWGQLESEIDDACRAAITRRRADANWESRRGFDIYDPNDKRLLVRSPLSATTGASSPP